MNQLQMNNMCKRFFLGMILFSTGFRLCSCNFAQSAVGSDMAREMDERLASHTIKLALIADKAFDLHKSPLVSLLEVKLSQREGIQLLERAQIDKILQEQRLSVAGLLERDTVVKVGRLLRADAFLLLSIENSEDKKKNENKLLRVRLIETAHGLRIWDSFEQLDTANLESITQRITKKVFALASKLTLPAGRAVPVGIVDIHRVQLGERYRWLARALPGMLSVRLNKEPRIIMLEREDLKILHREKLLTEGEDTEFWNSAVLIDGYLQPGAGKDIEMKLRLRRASGEEIAAFAVLVEPNEPLTAVAQAATDIIRELLNAPPTAQWQPKQEAEEFFRQGQMLHEHTRDKDAIALLETAHALQPGNVFYTGALFENEWALRFRKGGGFYPGGTGISHYSDLELAELASRLVRQIRDGYEKSSLSTRDIYYRWARPSGPFRIGGLRSKGYFTSPVSVSTEQIRMINRENRRIWVKTMDKALKQQLLEEDLPQMNTLIRARLAWASSDDPEQLMANLKKAFVEFVMPPEMGGQIKSAKDRNHLYYQAFQAEFEVHSPEYLEQTQLKGTGESFLKLWQQYLKELTEVKDPVVRFNSYLALAQAGRRAREKERATETRHYCYKALKVLQKDLRTPDEPFNDSTKQTIRGRMKGCLIMAGIEENELVGIWEEIYEPLIEKKDVDNLVLWDPGWRPKFYRTSIPDVARRYFQLLERIAVVLQTRRNDIQVRKVLNNVRDAQARISSRFPQLNMAQRPPSLSVTMLLEVEKGNRTAGTGIGGRYSKLQENMLWVAFIGWPRNQRVMVELTGIDLAKKKLVALWRAEVSFTHYPRLTGMAVSENAAYLSIKDAGLVEFPGSLAEGREFLKNPKVLTQEHGLPSVLITSVAKNGNKLWIAYGDGGQESGLGIYDPKNRRWETIFCSTLRGDPPFNAGQPYVLYELTPALPDKLFFVLYDPKHSRNMERWTGLWKMDTNTRKLKHFGFVSISKPWGYIISSGEKWWCKNTHSLIRFDTNSETAKLVLGHPWWLKRYSENEIPELKFESDFFVPEPEGLSYGYYMGGHLDLSTASVHVDKLWARLGKSQIIIIQRGKSLAEAEVIGNNILNGGAVMRFLSTPYGLVAIGERTVGLIETENHEK